MTDYIKVNTSALYRDADTVQSCIQNMKTELENIKQSKADLDKMWDGPSVQVFKSRLQSQLDKLDEILRALESIHTYETGAVEKYQSCEEKIASLIMEIQV